MSIMLGNPPNLVVKIKIKDAVSSIAVEVASIDLLLKVVG